MAVVMVAGDRERSAFRVMVAGRGERRCDPGLCNWRRRLWNRVMVAGYLADAIDLELACWRQRIGFSSDGCRRDGFDLSDGCKGETELAVEETADRVRVMAAGTEHETIGL